MVSGRYLLFGYVNPEGKQDSRSIFRVGHEFLSVFL